MDWTWEQTMREIITHPIYRALKTPSERKAAFHAYLDKEAKRERVCTTKITLIIYTLFT